MRKTREGAGSEPRYQSAAALRCPLTTEPRSREHDRHRPHRSRRTHPSLHHGSATPRTSSRHGPARRSMARRSRAGGLQRERCSRRWRAPPESPATPRADLRRPQLRRGRASQPRGAHRLPREAAPRWRSRPRDGPAPAPPTRGPQRGAARAPRDSLQIVPQRFGRAPPEAGIDRSSRSLDWCRWNTFFPSLHDRTRAVRHSS